MLAKKQKLNLREHSFTSLSRKGWVWRGADLEAAYDFWGHLSQAAVMIPKTAVPKAAARAKLRRIIFDQLNPVLSSHHSLQLIIRVFRWPADEAINNQLQTLFMQLEQHDKEGVHTKSIKND